VLIIVEGPDGSGKSTFVERLTEAVYRGEHVNVLHARPPKDHPLDEYETPLLGYRPGRATHVICDRWHWGESIYPQVLGRPTQYDLAVRRHVELFLLSRGAVVVHLTTPWTQAAARVTQRGDNLVHPSQVYRLWLEYNQVARRTLLPVVPVPHDYGHAQLEAVLNVARLVEVNASALNSFTTYVGPTVPRVLLLGDVRHAFRPTATKRILRATTAWQNPADPRSPAFGPYPATSGHFLLSHMRTVRGVGIANACDVDDWRALWLRLGRPPVTTLGVESHRAVGAFTHGAAPHPQYVRRFHHHSGAEYAHVIERATNGEDLLKWRP
jgi:hypothetical protein